MKNRKIALLCTAALLVSLLSGCGKEVIVTPNPTPKIAQTQEETPEPTQDVEEYPLEEDFTVEIEGIEETVTMQLYDLSFTDYGNLEAGIYIDSSMYDVSFFEGGYVIAPIGAGEVSTFMEVRYFSDMSEDDLAAGIFDLYTSDLVTEDLGKNYTENGYARVVSGETADGTAWGAYIIQVASGGCAAIVMCLAPEAIEGHGMRLMTSAATFFEK